MKKEIITIKDLKLDAINANKHTEYGMGLLEKSLSQLGAGRSILLDKDNNVICGNAVTETAGQIGMNKVKIVETDGTEIIAVKRMDLSITDKKAKELAIADNSIANKNLDWDVDILKDAYEDIDVLDWGVDIDFPELNDNSNNNNLEYIDDDKNQEMYSIIIKCESEFEQKDIMKRFNLKKPHIKYKDVINA